MNKQPIMPRKLQTAMKEVICPNCRYKFKTPKVNISKTNYQTEAVSQISYIKQIQQKLLSPNYQQNKHLNLQLDFIKQLEQQNSKKQLRNESSFKQTGQKSPRQSKQSIDRERKLSSISRIQKNSQKYQSVKNVQNVAVPDIKLTCDKDIQVQLLTQKIYSQINKFKQTKQFSIQCDSFSLNSESQIVQSQFQRNPQKYLQFNQKLNIQVYNAINKVQQNKNKLFDEAIYNFIEYYKNQPLVCNALPSYLKAIILQF